MTLAEANVKFTSTGSDKVKSDVEKVGSAMKDSAKQADDFSNSLRRVAEFASGDVLGATIRGLAGSLLNFGKEILQAGINAESADARFTAFGLNASKTRKFLTDVAESSSLTSNQLQELALGLQQSGFNIYSVIPRFAKWSDAIGGGSEKLQGMLRLLNLLRSGVKPDQELLQSLGFSDILIKSGLKFDQGKLIGGIRPAIEAVMKEIDRMTGKISEKMGQTFEAKLASVYDVFDKMKETVGLQLINMAKPWIDALKKTLSAVVSSGVFKDAVNEFFKFGNKISAGLANGINNPEVQKNISTFIGNVLGYFSQIPNYFVIIGQIISRTFSYLAKEIEPLIKAAKQPTGQKVMNVLGDLFIPRWVPDTATNKGLNFDDLTKKLGDAGKTAQMKGAEYSARIAAQMAKNVSSIVKPTGSALLETATLGSGRDTGENKSKKDKEKKESEKQTNLLDLIVQNTQKANELTLRNLTYGGGQLAASGISAVQMSGNRGAKSPQINANNDIVRGVEKIVRGYSNSNNLNFSFRRA